MQLSVERRRVNAVHNRVGRDIQKVIRSLGDVLGDFL